MRLRNKKTGGICKVSKIVLVWDEFGTPIDIGEYESIKELIAEWEEVEDTNDLSKEPLIKDEKIRKAVRAWAEMLGTDKARVVYHKEFVQPYSTIYARDGLDEYRLEIPCEIVAENIGYTITELCGEEK